MFRQADLSESFPEGMREAVRFNRLAADMSYQWFCALQDHAANSAETVWKHVPAQPAGSEKTRAAWLVLMEKERENFKRTLDSGFDAVEEFFAQDRKESREQKASSSQKSAETQAEKSSSAKKESSASKTPGNKN